MGERDFKARYRDNKREADSAARSFENGEIIEGWRYEPDWIDGPGEVSTQAKYVLTGLGERVLKKARLESPG
jgi:hypothetical protein